MHCNSGDADAVGIALGRMTPAAVNKMNATVDVEYLRYKAESGAYIRQHFCGPEPALEELVARMPDDEIGTFVVAASIIAMSIQRTGSVCSSTDIGNGILISDQRSFEQRSPGYRGLVASLIVVCIWSARGCKMP